MHIALTTSSAPWVRALRATSLDTSASDVSDTSSSANSTVVISPMGRVLGAAITRAEKATRDASPSELRSLVERTQNLLMDNWHDDAVRHADKLPPGADEARRDIAQRAAHYIERLTAPQPSAGVETENPFFGLSRAELAAIQYDESGSFTTNERRAASSEAGRQEGAWSADVCARAAQERERTGKMTHFLREILAHFDTLPAVEQAAAPLGYVERLRTDVAAAEKDDTTAWADYLKVGMSVRWAGVPSS